MTMRSREDIDGPSTRFGIAGLRLDADEAAAPSAQAA
jgi:hypothetical protein